MSDGRFARGLVVGKFSPLHKGHELLLRTALNRCESLLVISYSKPEFRGCGAGYRDAWFQALFPDIRHVAVTDARLAEWFPGLGYRVPGNDQPDSIHRDFVAFLCEQVFCLEVDAVFTSEEYGPGFAAHLTRRFRQRNPQAEAVAHVMVDRSRHSVPISATRVRENVHRGRQWLSAAVYSTFVKRICILGGESSGKSTLASAMAASCHTRAVPEYGRELWEQQSGRLEFADLIAIARAQVEREEVAAGDAFQFLFCDTSPLTTLFYSLEMFGRADDELLAFAARKYDRYVLCEPDFDFVQDGTRRDSAFRDRQHAWYLAQFEQRGLPYLTVSGPLAVRVATLLSDLGWVDELGSQDRSR